MYTCTCNVHTSFTNSYACTVYSPAGVSGGLLLTYSGQLASDAVKLVKMNHYMCGVHNAQLNNTHSNEHVDTHGTFPFSLSGKLEKVYYSYTIDRYACSVFDCLTLLLDAAYWPPSL